MTSDPILVGWVLSGILRAYLGNLRRRTQKRVITPLNLNSRLVSDLVVPGVGVEPT